MARLKFWAPPALFLAGSVLGLLVAAGGPGWLAPWGAACVLWGWLLTEDDPCGR